MRLSTKKQQTLLTLSVLLGLSSPVYAQDIQNNDVIVTPDVVVTATRTQEEVKVVPQTVEVITKEDIEQLGATDVYSALRLAANVDVTSAGMAGHNVMIRGMSTNHTLILIDGKRFAGEDTSATQNVYALGRFSLSNIERIEIVRGSASAQYGSDALGGVINIITKKSKEPSVMVGISTGSEAINNYYHIDFGKQGNFSSTFDMRFSDVRKNMQAGDEGSNYYGPIQDFNFAGTWDLGNDKEIDLTLGYYNEHTKADYADKYTSTGVFQTSKDKKEWYDYRRYDYSLGYSGKTDNSDYMIRTFYSRLDKENNLYNYRNNFPGSMENILGLMYPKYDWDKSTYTLWGIEGKNTVQLSDNHLLTFGGEYRQNKVEGTRLSDGGDNVHQVSQSGNGIVSNKYYSDKEINTWAGYIQDEWQVNDKLLVIPSVRYDHDSSFGGEVTPKIGATYFISDNSRVKANWGKGFKAPTISELYMAMHRAMGGQTVNVYGNPDLKPEKSTSWDISFEAEKDNNFGKLTYFNNDVKNLITTKQIGSSYYDQSYVNVDEAEIDGVEMEIGRNLDDKWTIKATSNWLDATDKVSGDRLDNRARNMTTLQLLYDDHDNWGYSAILWQQWANKYHYNDNDYNFTTTNFVLNKKFGEGNRVYAGVDNIFDKKISDIGLYGMIWRLGAEWTF
jgi:outer membrane receptor for ferrienterochelin and colicins